MLVFIIGDIAGVILTIWNRLSVPVWVWVVVLLIGFCVAQFMVFHNLRQKKNELQSKLDEIMNARPNVEFDSVSAEPYQGVYYFRLVFRNSVHSPSGDASTAKGTTARIEVLARDNGTVDSWDGRWAQTNPPESYEDITDKNSYDIPANKTAILDVGFRVEGQLKFQGHDNLSLFYKQPRKPLNPDSYYVQVALRASNMGVKELRFTLDIPNEPQ